LSAWAPRVFHFEGFLTPEECDYLISLGEPHMKPSYVVDSETGKNRLDSVRTSNGMFLRRGQDAVVRRIEGRIALYSNIPVENGEGIQILRYQDGQQYRPHQDYFHDTQNVVDGGQRVATMLMYLSDVEEGGETVFPNVPAPEGQGPRSECGAKGLSVPPRKGDAVLFWSLDPEGREDPDSLHGGCPVLAGTKWSATKWMRSHHRGN